MYYYYNIATGEYIGCGNESTAPEGCEARTTPPEIPAAPNPRIAELQAALIALDVKRIRPTAEGDAEYLSTLNAQAVEMREELRGLLEF